MKKILIDKGTGEVLDSREPAFVKLYLNHICDIHKASSGARNVLYSMVKRMQYDGIVAIRPKILESIANECGMKGKTKIQQVRNKISELSSIGYLKKEDHGVYAVNPWYFGRGDWQKILNDRHSGIKGIKFTTLFTNSGMEHSAESMIEGEEGNEEEGKKPPAKVEPKPNPFSDEMNKHGVDESFIDQILKHRREIGSKRPTPKAMNLILLGMIRAVQQGLMPSMDDCLEYLVNETTWQSFKPEWIKNTKPQSRGVTPDDQGGDISATHERMKKINWGGTTDDNQRI